MRTAKHICVHIVVLFFIRLISFSSEEVTIRASMDKELLLKRMFFEIDITLSNNSDHSIYILEEEFYGGGISFNELQSGKHVKRKTFIITGAGLTTFLTREDIIKVQPKEKLTKKIQGRVMYDQNEKMFWLNFFSYDVPISTNAISLVNRYSVSERLISQAEEWYGIHIYDIDIISTHLNFIPCEHFILVSVQDEINPLDPQQNTTHFSPETIDP